MTGTPDTTPREAHQSWAETHCYLCGVDLPAHQIELIRKLNTDNLTEAEMEILNTLDCPNNCWAKEAEAQARVDAEHGKINPKEAN